MGKKSFENLHGLQLNMIMIKTELQLLFFFEDSDQQHEIRGSRQWCNHWQ